MGMDPICVVFARLRVCGQAHSGVSIHQQIPEYVYRKAVGEYIYK